MNKFVNTNTKKAYFSKEFNYIFDKQDGQTIMWGASYQDDPEVSPFNVIVDFEITEKCSGIGNYGPCKFCYKSNTPYSGYVTSLEEAKTIIDKLPRECTQIAFGTDAKLETNPDWYNIFKYARERGFIPNVTVADLTSEKARQVMSVCGAVAVSRYHDKEICYNTISNLINEAFNQILYVSKKNTDIHDRFIMRNYDILLKKNVVNKPDDYEEMSVREFLTREHATDEDVKYFMNKYFAVNIHMLLSKETMPIVYETLNDIQVDERLKYLNAIVFLSLKRKGRGEGFHVIPQEEFENLIWRCRDMSIRFGFDSCSANKFLKTIAGTEMEYQSIYVEKCESGRMSFYINARGEGFPCSFAEGTKGWETGIDVINCNDFVEDVWNNPRIQNFREFSLMNNCNCVLYNV